jgi:hypothetical protein
MKRYKPKYPMEKKVNLLSYIAVVNKNIYQQGKMLLTA